MLKLLTLIIFFVLSACATKWNDIDKSKENTQKRNSELLNDFELDQDIKKKFAEKNELKSKSKLNKKNKKKSKVQNKKNVKKINKKLLVKTAKKPSDYPIELKRLNKNLAKLRAGYDPIFINGEKAYIDINYLGVSTGRIILSTLKDEHIGEEPVYHINAKVKTARFYRYLYELDDQVDSYISKKKLVPLKFSLIQRESGKNIDDLQLFDLDKKKVYSFYKKEKKGNITKKKTQAYLLDYFHDPLSLIYFIRGLNFKLHKEYKIPFYNKGVLKFFGVKVLGEEVIDTEIGKMKALKIQGRSEFDGDTVKSGNMLFWFSADSKKIFLKFKAKISIGSVSGDIEKYSE